MAAFEEPCVGESIESVTKELSDKFNVKFVLKEEQNVAITDLLGRKDVLAVLPTGYGKSLIYQYFVVAKAKQNMWYPNMCASALVICPLTGLIDDQIMEAANLGITAGRLTDVLKE